MAAAAGRSQTWHIGTTTNYPIPNAECMQPKQSGSPCSSAPTQPSDASSHFRALASCTRYVSVPSITVPACATCWRLRLPFRPILGADLPRFCSFQSYACKSNAISASPSCTFPGRCQGHLLDGGQGSAVIATRITRFMRKGRAGLKRPCWDCSLPQQRHGLLLGMLGGHRSEAPPCGATSSRRMDIRRMLLRAARRGAGC